MIRLLGPLALAILCFECGVASAQDLRRVISPNGDLEFRLFVAPQPDRNLFRLAYQIDHRKRPLIDTSFLGLDIWDQEPVLGENTGLIEEHQTRAPEYNGFTGLFMQNGSIGRLLRVEVRVFDIGVAFRYQIPPSPAMFELLIADEMTEFNLAKGAAPPSIAEVRAPGYPPMRIDTDASGRQITRLPALPGKHGIAFEGKTPFTTSWRLILIGESRIPNSLLK